MRARRMTGGQRLTLALALVIMALNVGLRAAHATSMNMMGAMNGGAAISAPCLESDPGRTPVQDGDCCPACSVFCAVSCTLPAAILTTPSPLPAPEAKLLFAGHGQALARKAGGFQAFSIRAPPSAS